MNSMPRLTEPKEFGRYQMWLGLSSAWLLVRKVACREFKGEDKAACWRVLKHIDDAMTEHWAKGTAFERKESL